MKMRILSALAVVAILLAAVLAPAMGALSLMNNSNSSVNESESLTPTPAPAPLIAESDNNATDTETNETETTDDEIQEPLMLNLSEHIEITGKDSFGANETPELVIEIEPDFVAAVANLSDDVSKPVQIQIYAEDCSRNRLEVIVEEVKISLSPNINTNVSRYKVTIPNPEPGKIKPGIYTLIVELGEQSVEYPLKWRLVLTIAPVLTASKKHFVLNEEPTFTFEYSAIAKTEETLISNISSIKSEPKPKAKQIKKWVSGMGTENISIETFVYHRDKLTDIEPEIEKLGKGQFSIQIPSERAFRAGLYKLKVELIKDNKTYVEEQDFTWGVLAINTHKSIYLPDETAFIGMAVLDNEGHMVCDADVTLTITDPDNKETVLSTSNGLIRVSPECCVYGVTNLPDYYTNYTVGGVGTYVMTLTAVTPDGTKSITDEFTVQSSVDFDVTRDGPTRIYPPVPYVVNFTIKANKNYNGLIKEYVPASFAITPQDGLTVTTAGDTKILSWNRNLIKGETYNIAYEFDAPDISPYLFVLGVLEIGDWHEAREWMIASDAQTGGCQCKTVASGIGHVGIYDESYGSYPAGEKYTDENGHIYWKVTHTFPNVPSNIILARVRTGCWGGSPCNGGDGFNISINGFTSANYNAIDPCHDTTLRCDVLNWSNNSNSPSTTGVCQLDTTGCGQSYIRYNATPHVGPGSNTITMIQSRATVNPKDWGGSWGSWHGWGAAYGIFFLRLFVLYENESMPEAHYFINEGTTLIVKESMCEPNSYESFIYFNGSKVYTGSARKVTLSYPAPGATGVSYFNGHNLTGGYPWSDIPPGYLVPFNNLFYYYDDTMPDEPGQQIFDRTIWTQMIIEYERSDLTVTNLSAQTLYANYYNTINATVLNNVGNVSSFNLTLYANGSKVDVQYVSSMSAGESKEVSFTWKPTSEGIYELNVTADAEDIVLETNEANNTKTEIVNVEPAPVPIWRSQSSNVTEIHNGGSIELRAQGSAKHGLDYAVLWTDETGTWMGCNNYGSPMGMFSLQSDFFTHTSDAHWNAQTRENLAVAAGDVKLLWTEAGGNIALSQPSYASSYEYCEGPGDGNDGDEGTSWYAVCPEDYTYDWWYVDLGEIKNVGKIVIKDVGYLGTYGHYDIQISDDASSWTTKKADQTNEGLVTFDGLDWSCRYVRFYVEHNEGAGFAEFEVYGKSGYKSSGLLTSTATSTGNPIVSVTPTWNSTEPTGTSLSVNVSVDNGATWKPANKDEELTWDYDVPNTNLKYKVLFETTNTSKTPVLHDITLNYKTKNAPKETWVWSNFTWQNASVTAGTVSWKICYNDTVGQTTCTDVMTFDVVALDTTPPYTAGHDPAPGATGVPRNTNITVHVKDDGDGVDDSTLVMKVDGSIVTPVISGSPADYTLVYDPPDFDFGQVVPVTVNASDLASPPNDMTTDSYSFTVVSDKPDLIIKDIDAYHNATGYPAYFNLSNEVDMVIENVGGVASVASNVSLYINESCIGKTDVPGLDVLSNTTVQFKWTPSGCDCEDGCNPDTFILEAIADCDNAITELNESNNASTAQETAYWNGYSADEPLVEVQHGTIHGGLNFTTGDGSYTSLTTHGSSKDIHYNLTLPSGATVALARLNVYYLWSKYGYPIMAVNITNQTGTYTVPLNKSYNDRPCSSPGVTSNNPSGNYVYNVTAYINGSGDYTVTVKNNGNATNESNFAIYAPGLVILYEDSTAPEYEYWILEGADLLEGGRKSGSGNLALAECINNATLPGIDKSGVETATLGLATPAGDGSGSDSYLYFNGNEIGTDVYHGHGSQYSKTLNGIAMEIGSTDAQVGVNVTDVKDYLDASSNVVGQGDDGDSMVVANVFLLVEQVAVSDTTPPTWDTTTGIQSAIDTGIGGEVTVTYGTATDADSPPIKYNIYYNTSSPATGGTKKSDVGSSPYTVTGLTNGQLYYFTVRVEDSVTPPNEDTNTEELTATPTDTTPPASITNLHNSTYAQTYINWTWTNPEDGDFYHTMVYINGSWEANVSTPFYNDTGLTPETEYNISTHTVDTSNNVNLSWVNDSAWTAPTPPPAPIIKLRREQANTTGVNQATTVRLIVWNTDSSENNITSLNLTEWIDSDWAVTDCEGCDENTSTYIKWNLGDLPKDNYTMVSYKIKAPASSEISTFKANCTYKYDGQTGSEEGSEFGVAVESGKAFFDFELDMNAFTTTIDRDVPEGAEKTVLYSVTNVGDAVPCDTVFIELQVNKTAWNVTCAYCDEFYNDTGCYYLKWNESSWDVQETKVFNFTVNSSHVGYYNFTSNGTYDPPASAFTGQIYYKMAGMSLSASPDPEEANANEPEPRPKPEPEEPLIKLIKDGKTYVEEQDFTWGVLAINAHKSIYLPDETAFIGMAVLDDEGHMVCDADVTLTITDPGNKETVLSTGNGLIHVSPECCVYGVTDLPDYYTNYEVGGVGTYVMNLTAVTADGTGTKSIIDEFVVQSSVDFDVARDGPTRIYPPVPYVMNFTIKANKNYHGLIKEYVPASFDITPQEGLTVTTAGDTDTKILTWNKNLVKGETYNIYYEFDAPDISPYLFVLGALEVGNFKESRKWQIASDARQLVSVTLTSPANNSEYSISTDTFIFTCHLDYGGGAAAGTTGEGNWTYCAGIGCTPNINLTSSTGDLTGDDADGQFSCTNCGDSDYSQTVTANTAGTYNLQCSATDQDGPWLTSAIYTITVTPDTTPPASITNLQNTTYASTYINWSWTNPADADFNHTMVYINGNWKENVSSSLNYSNATGLSPNTNNTISTHTVDTSGNVNLIWVNHSAWTAPSAEKIWVTNIEVHFVRVKPAAAMDTTPPASITSLHNATYAPTYINWSWVNPADADFLHVMIYIDGTFKENVLSPSNYYNATGFTANTRHTISTHTVDTSGNVNLSWVNHSAWTAPAPAGAPTVEIITITPDDDGATAGVQINPVPNSTKTVNITAQVSDPNGYEDISTVKITDIVPDPTSGDPSPVTLNFISGSGTTATYEGTFDMQFYDISTTYTVTVTATDTGDLTGSNSSSFEYQTCIALELDVASIAFGSVDPGESSEVIGDTVFPNAAPTIKNSGNVVIDMRISGTNMSGSSGTIPVNNIYDDLNNPDGYTALSNTPTEHDELNLTAGASSVHGIDFKLNVPTGTSAGDYSGTVTLEVKLDD